MNINKKLIRAATICITASAAMPAVPTHAASIPPVVGSKSAKPIPKQVTIPKSKLDVQPQILKMHVADATPSQLKQQSLNELNPVKKVDQQIKDDSAASDKNGEDKHDTNENVQISVSAHEVDTTTASDEEIPETDQTDNVAEHTQPTDEWANKLMVSGDDAVTVYDGCDTESDPAGKMRPGDIADITGDMEGWYQIQSGNLKGYIAKDSVVVGDFAHQMADNLYKSKVTSNTDDLRVRNGGGLNADIIAALDKGESVEEAGITSVNDGWVAIQYKDQTAYVSCDYVTVTKPAYTTGITSEEEAAQEAAARQAQEAAAKKARVRAAEISAEAKGVFHGEPTTQGEAAISYAQQFLGNPYVYGGTSLTNGIDCSGYVMQVYAHFGISLPHSSAADRSVGTEVSEENIQPGDIVCYAGHVGLYAGGGQIINASSPSTGIKYTPMHYKQILTIRRVTG